MTFQSYFDKLPFNGTFDNGMPKFPMGGAYWGTPVQQPAPAAPTQAYTDPANLPGSQAPGLGNISGFQGAGPDGTGITLGGGIGGSGLGDAQFAAFGFNPIDYGTQGNGGNSDLSNIGSNIWDAVSGKISNKADTIGNNINSLGNMPHFDNANIAQTGINAAGLFSPFVPLLAGAAQGFNLFDPTSNTGNAATNVIAQPGVIQSGAADLFNWINRQFGGNYMPYGVGSHASQEPGMQDALGNAIQSAMNPGGPGIAMPPLDNGNGSLPIPGTGESNGGGDFIGTSSLPPDFFAMGGNVPNIGGADIFNSIGATPWGGGGFGGGGDVSHIQPDNNGGWGQ